MGVLLMEPGRSIDGNWMVWTETGL